LIVTANVFDIVTSCRRKNDLKKYPVATIAFVLLCFELLRSPETAGSRGWIDNS